jgi:hypothetical protein
MSIAPVIDRTLMPDDGAIAPPIPSIMDMNWQDYCSVSVKWQWSFLKWAMGIASLTYSRGFNAALKVFPQYL